MGESSLRHAQVSLWPWVLVLAVVGVSAPCWWQGEQSTDLPLAGQGRGWWNWLELTKQLSCPVPGRTAKPWMLLGREAGETQRRPGWAGG